MGPKELAPAPPPKGATTSQLPHQGNQSQSCGFWGHSSPHSSRHPLETPWSQSLWKQSPGCDQGVFKSRGTEGRHVTLRVSSPTPSQTLLLSTECLLCAILSRLGDSAGGHHPSPSQHTGPNRSHTTRSRASRTLFKCILRYSVDNSKADSSVKDRKDKWPLVQNPKVLRQGLISGRRWSAGSHHRPWGEAGDMAL